LVTSKAFDLDNYLQGFNINHFFQLFYNFPY
jgi:hypothetical protein